VRETQGKRRGRLGMMSDTLTGHDGKLYMATVKRWGRSEKENLKLGGIFEELTAGWHMGWMRSITGGWGGRNLSLIGRRWNSSVPLQGLLLCVV